MSLESRKIKRRKIHLFNAPLFDYTFTMASLKKKESLNLPEACDGQIKICKWTDSVITLRAIKSRARSSQPERIIVLQEFFCQVISFVYISDLYSQAVR